MIPASGKQLLAACGVTLVTCEWSRVLHRCSVVDKTWNALMIPASGKQESRRKGRTFFLTASLAAGG